MSFIQLRSGAMFDVANPRPEDIRLSDVAHALARLCRYTGHSRVFASVAEHSVHVSLVVDPAYAREGLLHDASEAFVGDVAAPLKRLLPDYQRIERAIVRAVARRFSLLLDGSADEWPAPVREADVRMLGIEARAVMQPTLPHAALHWGAMAYAEPHPAVERIGRGPHEAERMFLNRCEELGVR